RLGLLDALDRAIPDPRNPELITHSQRSLLAQRVLGIALGYEDLNDHSCLRDDPLWQALAERAPEPCSTCPACWSSSSSPPSTSRLRAWCWTSTPPTTPSTAGKRAASS